MNGNDPAAVLIAEDEPIASMALRAQLEALEFRVIGPARDGDEAVALGACYPVDVALFDVRMPGRSGLQAALDLFKIAPTPVVLLTGVGAADLPDPIPEPPIFQVLTKPVGLAELRAGLDSARARFQRWMDTHGIGPEHMHRRAAVADTVERMAEAEGVNAVIIATRLLKQARDQGRSPAAVARGLTGQS